MAKRTAFLHIGLPHSSGPLYTAALATYTDTLSGQGLEQPAGSADELFRAAVELRRDHRAWGLRRKDVEGIWARIGRRAYRAGTDVVLSHELLAGCTTDEVALLLDGLAGLKVRVIITASAPDARVSLFPDDHDLAEVAERWATHLKSPDRLHVVITDPADPQPGWEAFGEIAGFDAAALPLPDPRGVARTTDMAALRVIASSTASLASDDDLAALGKSWAADLLAAGYSVHGDPAALAPAGGDARTDETEDRLTVVTTALADSIAELARLRSDNQALAERNATLERKRAKLKRKLAKAG